MSDDELSIEDNFFYDPKSADKHKQKKKKKGVKKLASQMKKGTGTVVVMGGDLVNRTRNTTVGAVRGTANVTMGAVKGTTKLTKSTVKGARNVTKKAVKGTTGAAKGSANWMGLRRRKKGGSSASKGKAVNPKCHHILPCYFLRPFLLFFLTRSSSAL